MRVVSLEEHVSFPDMLKLMPPETLATFGSHLQTDKETSKALADVEGERLHSMDKQNIAVQVLSVVGPGANLLNAAHAPAFATAYNDALAQRISNHRDRFAAFAHLPMTAPEAAAAELERTVRAHGFKGTLINGLTENKFLDDPMFAPILKKAEDLSVPIYLHPGLPPEKVYEAYYSDLPKSAGQLLSIAGWGWHSETALHILRLIVSGTLDKYPKLKLIIGHMGEMLPMMMMRCDSIFKPDTIGINRRSVRATLTEQVFITTSGIFTVPPLLAAVDTFGIDNILFSVDYPFSGNEEGMKFLNSLPLTERRIRKIASENADALLRLG